MARQPKDFEYRAEYEPDMARMVQALRVLLDYNPQNPQVEPEKILAITKKKEVDLWLRVQGATGH